MAAARGHVGAREALRSPSVPAPLAYLVEYWSSVASGRTQSGMGAPSLGWQDVAGWMHATGTPLLAAEGEMILRMDREFLRAALPPEK